MVNRRRDNPNEHTLAVSQKSGRQGKYVDLVKEPVTGLWCFPDEIDHLIEYQHKPKPKYIDSISLDHPLPEPSTHPHAFNPYLNHGSLAIGFTLASDIPVRYDRRHQHPELHAYIFFWDADEIPANYEIDSVNVLTDLDGYAVGEISEDNHHAELLIPAFTGNMNHRIALAVHNDWAGVQSYEYDRPSGVLFNQVSTIEIQRTITILGQQYKTYLTGEMLPELGGHRIIIGV